MPGAVRIWLVCILASTAVFASQTQGAAIDDQVATATVGTETDGEIHGATAVIEGCSLELRSEPQLPPGDPTDDPDVQNACSEAIALIKDSLSSGGGDELASEPLSTDFELNLGKASVSASLLSPEYPASAARKQAGLPPPTQGRSVNLLPLSGTILVKLPGSTAFTPVEEPEAVPVGSTVDVSDGAVSLISSQAGRLKNAEFRGGAFKILQSARRRSRLKAKLLAARGCSQSRGSVSARAPGSSTGNSLWSRGRGRYRTQGYRGSATVRGTDWVTTNRCDGSTLFQALDGAVAIDDFGTGEAVDAVIRGPRGSYLAKPGA